MQAGDDGTPIGAKDNAYAHQFTQLASKLAQQVSLQHFRDGEGQAVAT